MNSRAADVLLTSHMILSVFSYFKSEFVDKEQKNSNDVHAGPAAR